MKEKDTVHLHDSLVVNGSGQKVELVMNSVCLTFHFLSTAS